MKISTLTENPTVASAPTNSSQAPEFGRSDKFLEEKEEQIDETTSGSVATVATPVGGTQRRAKGSMFSGIKTSKKFANSTGVNEAYGRYGRRDAYQRDYDSSVSGMGKHDSLAYKLDGGANDEGWDEPQRSYQARPAYQPRPRPAAGSNGMYFYNVPAGKEQSALAHGLKQTRTGKWFSKQQNKVADSVFGPGRYWEPKNESISEAESTTDNLRSWQVVIMNNYYRGKYSDYSGRYYYVLASSPQEAKQVVLDNADGILQDLLSMKSQNGRKILPRSSAVRITADRIGKIEDGTVSGRMSTTRYRPMFSPQGVMMVKLTNGAIDDVQEQGVSEGYDDEEHKTQGEEHNVRRVDMTGKECEKCHKGDYQETGVQDDMHGVLHCTTCGKQTDRWKMYRGKSVAEDKGMSQYNAFKREWRTKHGSDAKVPGYDSKEYTSYCYRQNDKKQGVAEGWDPDTTRLEQDVRDALENGDDYTAKQYAKMAPTAEAKKYLLNIIKQAMYIDDLGGETDWKGVVEGSGITGNPGMPTPYDQGRNDAKKGRAYDNPYDQPGEEQEHSQYKKGYEQGKKQGVAEESDRQFAQRMKKKAAQPPTKGMSQKEKEDKGWRNPNVEQIYNILALDKGNALKKPTKLKWKASSLEDIFDALAAQDWYPLEINGVEVIAGKRLKQGVAEEQVNEKSKSQAQFRTMAAVAHNPKFAKKVGISQKVGKEFHSADRKQDYKDLPKEVDEEKQRLDPKCWSGYKKQGTKMKGDTRVNNCVKVDETELNEEDMLAQSLYKALDLFKKAADRELGAKPKDKGVQKKVDEVSSELLGRYKKGASAQSSQLDKEAFAGAPDAKQKIEKSNKRYSGIIKATKKQFANDAKGVAEDSDPCWDNYKQIGMKNKNGKKVPNCVPKESVEENFNGEYDDEAGSAESNLLTTARAVKGLLDTIDDRDNLPEWVQEKIAKAEQMLVASWDYLQSQEEQGVDPQIDEMFDMIEEMVESLAQEHGVDSEVIWEDFESVPDQELFETAAWRRKEGKNKNGGLNAKGVASYRRENPGSKLQTAVTTKPSKLKKGSKAAKRRKSFCARMGGMKGPMKDENGKPTRKALALRKWNC